MKTLLKSTYAIPIQGFFLYCWLVNLQGTDSYYSVYLLVAAVACFAMQQNYQKKVAATYKTLVAIWLLSLGFAAAIVLANYSLFEPWTALQSLFEAGCTLLGGWIAFYHILFYMVSILPLKIAGRNCSHSTIVFLGSFVFFAGIFLIHLYLRIYPGILTRDSVTTIEQILECNYNNTMPFWHTMTVQVFFNLGMTLFGEINGAIALFHSVQCLFLAACFSYGIVTLYQIGIPFALIGVVMIGYGVMPYHIVYSVTLWKDVIFGAAALLMVTALVRIIQNIGKYYALNTVIFSIASMGLCLWRTNGMLAFGMLLVVMALTVRKKYKKLLFLMVIILLICWLLSDPMLAVLNIPGTDFVEALAIPFQQVSRVVASDLPLTEKESQMLNDVFLLDLVPEKYDPSTVDPIKFEALRSAEPLKQNPLGYAGLWLKLGLKYPGVYLAAWVEETKGYWNGGYEFWIYTYNMSPNSIGIVSCPGENLISSLFKAGFRYLEKLKVLQPLYSIGLAVWITVICCFVNVQKRRDEFLLSLPGIVIVIGLLIGTPVFAEFRYAYPIFTTVPVILCCTLFTTEERNQ